MEDFICMNRLSEKAMILRAKIKPISSTWHWLTTEAKHHQKMGL